MDSRLNDLIEHADWVRGLAEGLILDQVEVDDVVQETWLTAIERSEPRIVSPRGWLASVVRNVALQMSRGERRRRRALPEVSVDGATLEDRANDQLDLHRRLVTAVESLRDDDRSLIVMRYFEGRLPRDMARELDLPVTTVRNRLSRALERLRSRLDRDSGGRQAWSLAFIGLLTGTIVPRVAATSSAAGATAAGTKSADVARRLASLRTAAAVFVVGAFFAVYYLTPTDGDDVPEAVAERADARYEPLMPRRSSDTVAMTEVAASPGASRSEAVVVDGAAEPLHIQGVVVDRQGAPIASAGVRVVDVEQGAGVALDEITKFERRAQGSAAIATTATDAAGRFDVTVSDPGAYRVVVAAPGYGLGIESTGSLAGGDSASLEFALDEAPRIACVVTDEDGTPIPDAAVTVHTPEGWVADHSRQMVERTTTRDDGTFEFDLQQIAYTDVRDFVWDNLTGGRVSSRQAVTLEKRGRATRTFDRFGGLSADEEGRLVLVMQRARDVYVTFVPPPGETISGPIDFLAKMHTSRIIRRGRSDARGRAVVTDLPEGRLVRFVVDTEGWVVDYPENAWIGTAPSQAGLPIDVSVSGDCHVDVPLAHGVVVRGRAVDTDGRPVRDVELLVAPHGGNLGARSHLRRTITKDDGTFVVDGVVPGRLGVFSESKDWAIVPGSDGEVAVRDGHRRGHRLDVQPRRTYDIVLRMVATSGVRGRVLDRQGDSLPGASVELGGDGRQLQGWPPVIHALLGGPKTRCDEAGRFRLDGLVPGTDVELMVRDLEGRPTRSSPLGLVQGEPLRGVELRTGEGCEIVVDVRGPDGGPIASFDVMIAVGREYRFYPLGDDSFAKTDDAGRAIFRAVPSGLARVVLGDVRRLGFILPHDFEPEIRVPRIGELRVEVVLARPVSIVGHVVDEEGEPIDGANVIAYPEKTDEHDVRRVRTMLKDPASVDDRAMPHASRFYAARSATTDIDGRFVLAVDRERAYRFACFEDQGSTRYQREVKGDAVVAGREDSVVLVVGPRSAPRSLKGRSR